MSGIRHQQSIRSAMTMLCIAVFLFNYVNATMFWHGHSEAGYWVFHSHIASASHRAVPSENPHNAAELLLIEAADQASFTDEVMPACDLEPLRIILGTVQTQPESGTGICPHDLSLLRGPPALV